jgi:hypothetical protein
MKNVEDSVPQVAMIPDAATLDKWCSQEWANGIQVDELKEFDTLVVETEHHTYEITVINPTTGEVSVRGGELFHEKTPALILGSSMRRAFLKRGGIYVGLVVELQVGSRRIITSRVRRIMHETLREPNPK